MNRVKRVAPAAHTCSTSLHSNSNDSTVCHNGKQMQLQRYGAGAFSLLGHLRRALGGTSEVLEKVDWPALGGCALSHTCKSKAKPSAAVTRPHGLGWGFFARHADMHMSCSAYVCLDA